MSQERCSICGVWGNKMNGIDKLKEELAQEYKDLEESNLLKFKNEVRQNVKDFLKAGNHEIKFFVQENKDKNYLTLVSCTNKKKSNISFSVSYRIFY